VNREAFACCGILLFFGEFHTQFFHLPDQVVLYYIFNLVVVHTTPSFHIPTAGIPVFSLPISKVLPVKIEVERSFFVLSQRGLGFLSALSPD
jgi:hypothetical protein